MSTFGDRRDGRTSGPGLCQCDEQVILEASPRPEQHKLPPTGNNRPTVRPSDLPPLIHIPLIVLELDLWLVS